MPEFLEDQVRRLNEILSRRNGDESFGVALAYDSVATHRDRLLGEFMDANLHMGLRRAGQSSGAEVGFVAEVLRSLQASLASIAQSLSGAATRAGLIPAHIRESVELRIVDAAPGSLDMKLVPAFPADQLALFAEEGSAPLLEASLERVLRVLALATAPRDAVLGEIAELGQRATSHLGELSKALAVNQASADLEWNSPRGSAAAHIDSFGAATLQALLSEVHEETENEVYTGRLVGGSLVRRSFELEIDDDIVLRGKVAEDVLPMIEDLFGQRCSAVVEVRRLSLSSGEEREAYRLLSLAAA
jgi:hypothetical protein